MKPVPGAKGGKLDRLMARAQRLRYEGRHPDAAAVYDQVLRAAPGRAPAHLGLGIALRAQGRFEAAVACYRRALRLAPAAVVDRVFEHAAPQDLHQGRCRGIRAAGAGELIVAVAAGEGTTNSSA